MIIVEQLVQAAYGKSNQGNGNEDSFSAAS